MVISSLDVMVLGVTYDVRVYVRINWDQKDRVDQCGSYLVLVLVPHSTHRAQ
jgi:hypothetical protein